MIKSNNKFSHTIIVFAIIMQLLIAVLLASNSYITDSKAINKSLINESSTSEIYVNNSSVYNTDSLVDVNNINNLVMTVRFAGEEDTLNNVFTPYGKTYKEILDEVENTAENSLKNYVSAISSNKINVETQIVDDASGNSLQVDHERGYYTPYTSTNTQGYFKDELIYVNPGYENSDFDGINNISNRLMFSTTKYFVYEDDVNSVNDEINHICSTKFAKSKVNTDNRYKLVEGVDRFVREQNLVKDLITDNSDMVSNVNLDENSDGYIDSVVFILQDYASETIGWSDLLWPHQIEAFNLSSMLQFTVESHYSNFYSDNELDAFFEKAQVDGATLGKYNLMGIDSVVSENYYYDSAMFGKTGSASTLCHEFTHTLGWPDLYCYEDDSVTPVGEWDVMAQNGGMVAQYTNSYARTNAGWLTENNYETITDTGTYSLKPVSYEETSGESLGNRTVYYKIENKNYPGQFFIVEYRKREGTFDGGEKTSLFSDTPYYNLNESGLIVYRIDETVVEPDGYECETMVGNFGGAPYGMYIFRENYENVNDAALNEDDSNYGSTSASETNNIYSFADYSGTQSSLLASDVNYTNSGIKIYGVQENDLTDEITFSIDWTGVEFQEPILESDNKTITLKSNSNFTINDDSKISIKVDGLTQSFTTSKVGTDLIITLSNEVTSIATISIDSTAIVDSLGNYMGTDYAKSVEKAYSVSLIKNNINFECGTAFTDWGINYSNCSAEDFYLTKSGVVNINTIGTYTINYILQNKITNDITTLIRNVYVVDTSAPVIDLIGESNISLVVGDDYVDLGATVSDNSGEYITIITSGNVITSKAGVYNIIYTSSDSSGNTATVIRTVTVVNSNTFDLNIILNGKDTLYIYLTSEYIEQGASAVDNINNDVEILITGEVDTSVLGEYTVTYSATDFEGNTDIKTRTIYVVKPIEEVEIINQSEFLDDWIVNTTRTITASAEITSETIQEPEFKLYVNNMLVEANNTGEFAYTPTLSGVHYVYIKCGEARTDVILVDIHIEKYKTSIALLILVVLILVAIASSIIAYVRSKNRYR